MSATVSLLAPLAGLPGTEYELEPVDAGLFTLSARGSTLRLFVLAGETLPGYQPEVDDEQAEALGLQSPDDAELYVVVNPGEGAPTLNLLAPIVVNRRTRAAAQLVLDGARWPLRAALDEALAS